MKGFLKGSTSLCLGDFCLTKLRGVDQYPDLPVYQVTNFQLHGFLTTVTGNTLGKSLDCKPNILNQAL